jgi:hypothetical protein
MPTMCSATSVPGMEPMPSIARLIKEQLKVTRGRIGYETVFPLHPEGYLTRYEHALLRDSLPDAELVDAHAVMIACR